MTKWVLGAVAILAAVLVTRSFIGQRDAEWQARVERERARAEVSLTVADAATTKAATLQIVADSLRIEAESQDTVIVTQIRNLPAPPPDCVPFTAPRDTVILTLKRQQMTTIAALRMQREANALLRIAEASAHSAADSLAAVLDDRPKPVSPLIPKVGVGPTFGICSTGEPCFAVGVQLTWEVNLF